VIVRDINSGATQVKHLGFTVPKYDAKQLSTSTLVLAAKLQDVSDQPAVGQFTIGQFKVIPNVARTYRKGDPVGIYLRSITRASTRRPCAPRWMSITRS
jgi:hypothetical protein